MTGENTSQIDNSDWSLFHRTSDKRQVTAKLQQSDRQIWAVWQVFVSEDIFLSQSLVIVLCLSAEAASKLRLVRFI